MTHDQNVLRVGISDDAEHYLGTIEKKKIVITRVVDYYYFCRPAFKNLSQPITIVLQEVVWPWGHREKFLRKNRCAFYLWPIWPKKAGFRGVGVSQNYVIPTPKGFRYVLNDEWSGNTHLLYQWEEDVFPTASKIIAKMKSMIQRMTEKELELWLMRMSPDYDPTGEI